MGLGPKRYQPHPEATRAWALKEALISALQHHCSMQPCAFRPTGAVLTPWGSGHPPPTTGTLVLDMCRSVGAPAASLRSGLGIYSC